MGDVTSLHLPMQLEPEIEFLLAESLRNAALRRITIVGSVGEMLTPILIGLTTNTSTVDRTVRCSGMLNLSCEWVQIRFMGRAAHHAPLQATNL